MTGELFINGKDAYTTWGMSLSEGGLSALLTPPPMKENVKNKYRNRHGNSVSKASPKMDARELNLPVHFTAISTADFWAKYDSFCNELKTGFLDVRTSQRNGVIFHLEYTSCTQFSQFRKGIAKFILRVVENDPSNRT